MEDRKRSEKKRLLPAMLLTLALLCGCGATPQASAGNAMDFTFSDRDLDASYDEETAVKIGLSDDEIIISGEGASASGTVATISSAGTYLVEGSLSDGQIIIDAGDSDKIQLVLAGTSVSCSDNPALLIRSADKVFLTLAEGTENALADGGEYAEKEDGVSTADGAVFSKADLTINGGGSLAVTGNYKHGIVSKDDLIVTGGRLTVTANGQGLSGKDCIKIKDGAFILNTQGDALQSDNSEDAAKGFIYICGGSFDITTAEGDAVQAETTLRIDGGTFELSTGGGSALAAEHTEAFGPGGGEGQKPGDEFGNGERPDQSTGGGIKPGGDAGTPEGGLKPDGAEEAAASTKGLKAGTELLIRGGAFVIDSLDDSLHSNGTLTVEDGTITVTSGDDGLHADGDLVISGGTVTVTKSYEGIEGMTISISGGAVDVTASDDGFNAAGGNDGSSVNGRPGQNSFESQEGVFVAISGGEVSVSASGDGIDSNGDLTITGGTVTVSGPEGSGDGTLDYNGTAVISGGVLMGTGSNGMAQGFSEDSTQCSVLYNLSSQVGAGSKVEVKDESGKAILSWTAEKTFSSVQFSSPELEVGKTYTITAGELSESVSVDSVAAGNGGAGGMGGGPGSGGNGGMRPGGGEHNPSEGAEKPE